MTEQPPALKVDGLSKQFGGAQALDAVTLTVRPGEVHGLLGENGSGKSTVIKVLAGFHTPDEGRLEVNGTAVKLPLQPGQFRELGLDFVHQDLGLIDSLSVTDNLTLGDLVQPEHRWHVSLRAKRREAKAVFERYGLDIDPGAIVKDLLPVERALVAIVRAFEGIRRALAEGSTVGEGVLVLDEPTVFLTKDEVEELYRLIREIVATGASVLFVSHDLDEVRAITDTITVLRDGRVVGSVKTRDTSHDALVQMIIGRTLESRRQSGTHAEQTVEVSLRGVAGKRVDGIDIDLYRGEILGVTGIVGSGFEELPYLVYGGSPDAEGELTLRGRTYDLATLTPREAIAAGLALIPAERLRDGSIASLPVIDNLTLPTLDQHWHHGFLHRRRMTEQAAELMRRFDVRPSDPRLVYSSLSGGNQQKVLLAKWLQTKPSVLVLHEPTQGVDVGARQQIYEVIREAAASGTSVICASSDYEQLADLTDRVVVLGGGRVVDELRGPDVQKERISELCYAAA